MQTLTELIAQAESIVDAIAGHDDFVKLLEQGNWDDPAIRLCDIRQGLDDLKKAYDNGLDYLNTKDTQVSNSRRYEGLYVWCKLGDEDSELWHFLEWGCKCELSEVQLCSTH